MLACTAHEYTFSPALGHDTQTIWAPTIHSTLCIACIQSFLDAMQHVGARATIKANLKTYRYYDNVSMHTAQAQRTTLLCARARLS